MQSTRLQYHNHYFITYILCNRINKTVVALLKYELHLSFMISILIHTFIMYIVSVAHFMPALPINNIFQMNH